MVYIEFLSKLEYHFAGLDSLLKMFVGCSQIMFPCHGELVDAGTHDELMMRHGSL